MINYVVFRYCLAFRLPTWWDFGVLSFRVARFRWLRIAEFSFRQCLCGLLRGYGFPHTFWFWAFGFAVPVDLLSNR